MKKHLTDQDIFDLSKNKLSTAESRNVLCGMLEEFDRFCKENGLVYYLAQGTLIGAVRHRGFIPWDDDIDLYMLRKDFDQLLKFRRISPNIEIVKPAQNTGGIYHPFAYINLFDNRTVMISNTLRYNTGKGQFIDIFPLDNIPDNELLGKIQNRELVLLQRIRRKLVYKQTFLPKKGIKRAVQLINLQIGKRSDGILCTRLIDRIAQKYRNRNSSRVGAIAFNHGKDYIFKRDWFENTTKMEFEGRRYPVPRHYDEILSQTYGNYMEYPPKEEQVGHHFIDVYRKQ